MQFTIRPSRDTITPSIAGMIRAVAPASRKQVLSGLGEVIKNMAKRAFYDSSLRPIPWVPKLDGTPAKLMKDQVLRRSIDVIAVNANQVVVGSDRKYAAIHQLGGVTPAHVIRPKNKKALAWGGGHPVMKVNHPGSKIPARPYFPFHSNGQATSKARERLEAAARIRLRQLGMPV